MLLVCAQKNVPEYILLRVSKVMLLMWWEVNVCICVCLYVCRYSCTYVGMCLCVWTYVCIHACMGGWMNVCMYDVPANA